LGIEILTIKFCNPESITVGLRETIENLTHGEVMTLVGEVSFGKNVFGIVTVTSGALLWYGKDQRQAAQLLSEIWRLCFST
jgi:hypothetical protein